jgi:hypothetical protein
MRDQSPAPTDVAPVTIILPAFARVTRALPTGLQPYLALLPGALQSPALTLVEPDAGARQRLVEQARVRIEPMRGYCFVDVTTPAIVLAQGYYRDGSDLDLYLDLVHELTHLRQHAAGHNVWDDSYAYPDRPTEVEAYAIAVAEGRRLGMTDDDVWRHLSNPWMSRSDVRRLVGNIERLAGERGWR